MALLTDSMKQEESKYKPPKLSDETKSVLSRGLQVGKKLGGQALEAKGVYDQAMGVKSGIERIQSSDADVLSVEKAQEVTGLASSATGLTKSVASHSAKILGKAGKEGAKKVASDIAGKATKLGGPLSVATDVVSGVKGLKDIVTEDATGGFKTAEEAGSTIAGTAAAGLGVGATLTGTGTAAAVGAATGAAAGGAGLGASLAAGAAAMGPIGWAALAVGGTAAALGLFGNKKLGRAG